MQITVNPSGYTESTNITTSSSYPISNGYADTSSTSYARLSLSKSTAGYLYYTFDCSDIPSTATISSVSATAKVRISSTSRVTSTLCQLFAGTTAKGSNVTFSTTSSSNIATLSTGSSWTRSELDDLRMKIGGTGSSSNQSKYIYFYGAEVDITYVTESRTVTTTLSGNGTISPSGTTTTYDGEEFVLTITPTDTSATVTATQDGTDITSSLIGHGIETDTVLGTYSLISGGFNSSGESYFQGIVGNGYDTSSITTSNYYSSGSGTNAVFQYATPFSISSTATITNLYMMANGHAESTSNSSEYMCVQLKNSSTSATYTDQYNFKSAGTTSNTTVTVNATTLPTVSELANLVVECTLGYYGGAINGVTVFLEYTDGGVQYYTYTYTVSGDSTIAVTIGTSTTALYVKQNAAWVQVETAYVKTNGAWVEASISSVFNASQNIVYKES